MEYITFPVDSFYRVTMSVILSSKVIFATINKNMAELFSK